MGVWIKPYAWNLWAGACLGLLAVSAYSLGRMGTVSAEPVVIMTPADGAESIVGPAPARDMRVVVSAKSSSKKYHHSWCSGAKTIGQENQVWFATAAAAEAAGYTLSGNCRP
ncbi:MAG TPA: hypothetical protein VD862_04025 [Candidatus Paceibacterota bacterium]|nr:hypothetical protein [Candidatus Paceibacterota bacterium]